MSRMTTHHPRAARLTPALVIAVGALATLSASPATAGVVTHAYKAAVRTPGLSAAERRAISVKSITATADDSLGVLVSVQLQGDLERSLGRGGLANGLLALALVPKGSGGTPSGLIDQGGGLTRTAFALVGKRGRKLAGRGSVDLIGAERVTRMLTGARVQVIRAANRIIFYVADRDVGRIAGVRLEVFANSPIGSGPIAARSRAAAWARVLHAKPAFGATLSLDPSRLSGDDMDRLRVDLTQVRSSVLAPELSRQQRARAQLRSTIRGAALRKQTRSSRLQRLALTDAFRATTGGIAHLRAEIASAWRFDRAAEHADQVVDPLGRSRPDRRGAVPVSRAAAVARDVTDQGTGTSGHRRRRHRSLSAVLWSGRRDDRQLGLAARLRAARRPPARADAGAVRQPRPAQRAGGPGDPPELPARRDRLLGRDDRGRALQLRRHASGPERFGPVELLGRPRHVLPDPDAAASAGDQPGARDPRQSLEPAGVDEEQRLARQSRRERNAASRRRTGRWRATSSSSSRPTSARASRSTRSPRRTSPRREDRGRRIRGSRCPRPTRTSSSPRI